MSREGLNVGDYIDYEPTQGTAEAPIVYDVEKLDSKITGAKQENGYNNSDITQEDLDWQILKIYEDGSMDLIGSITEQEIFLSGATGYNNGVYVLDDVCKTLYSRGDLIARSVDLEDYEACMTETGKKAKLDDISKRVSNLSTGTLITKVDTENNTITYVTGRSYYPNIYASENGSGIDTTEIKTNGIGSSDVLKDENGNPAYDKSSTTNQYKKASANGLTVKYTHYYIDINNENYGEAHKAIATDRSLLGSFERGICCGRICMFSDCDRRTRYVF